MKKTIKAQIKAVSYTDDTQTSIITIVLDDGESTWEKVLTYKTGEKIEFSRLKNELKRQLIQDLKVGNPITELSAEIGNIFTINLN